MISSAFGFAHGVLVSARGEPSVKALSHGGPLAVIHRHFDNTGYQRDTKPEINRRGPTTTRYRNVLVATLPSQRLVIWKLRYSKGYQCHSRCHTIDRSIVPNWNRRPNDRPSASTCWQDRTKSSGHNVDRGRIVIIFGSMDCCVVYTHPQITMKRLKHEKSEINLNVGFKSSKNAHGGVKNYKHRLQS